MALPVPTPVLAAAAWDASVNTSTVPPVWPTNDYSTFDLNLSNTGSNTWPATGGAPVDVSVIFAGQNRDAVNDCLGDLGACRYALPADVPPGGSVTVHVKKATPFDHGPYTLLIDLVKETQFWFSAQTNDLPVSAPVQATVPCEIYCSGVMSTGPTGYWRLNDTILNVGSTRDAVQQHDFYFRGDMNSGVSGGHYPPTNDTDATAASIHVAIPFQPEPNNNSLNISGGAAVGPPGETTVTAVGGWVRQDPDQLGHGTCFIEGSPVNGNAWLCRDGASGTLSFYFAVLCSSHEHPFVAYGPAALDDGQWHYVLGRYQDAPVPESELWIDGQLVGTAPKPATGECNGTEPPKPIREVYVGQNFHGSLSEVAYWGGSLNSQIIGTLAAPVTAPGRPTILSVVPGNGNATVSWRAPAITGGSPITSYQVQSSPGSITRTVDGSTTSVKVPGLQHDCQTRYTFTVTATNAVGAGPVSLPSDAVLPSGHPSNPPSRVVIFVGGIGSFMPQTVAYDPLTNVPSYCGLKINQAAINADLYTTASYFDPSHPAAYPDPSPNLTDVVAAQGAVVLPFSYYGATFASFTTAGSCQPVFQVNAYPPSAPGNMFPEAAAAALNREVQSVKCQWPNAGIVIVGHSNGGLVAETYWKDFLPSNPANVKAVFSVDGVINGVANPIPFLDPNTAGGQLKNLQLSPWVVKRYFQIWQDRGARDAAIIQADANGVFVPIGTRGDTVYDIPDCYLAGGVGVVVGAVLTGCHDGRESQLLYVPPPLAGQTGTLIGSDFQTPQDATFADAIRAVDVFVSHALAMEHFAVIARIGTAVFNASSASVTAATMSSPMKPMRLSSTTTSTTSTNSTTSTTTDPTSQVPCPVTSPPSSVCALVLPDVVSAGQTIGLVGTGIGTSAGSVLFSSAAGKVNGAVTSWQSPVPGIELAAVVVPATATTGPVSLLTADGQLVHVGGVTVLGSPNVVTTLVATSSPSSPVWGQFTTVNVRAFNGKNPVAGATVALSDDVSSRTALTDNSGIARFQYTAFGTASLVAVSGSVYTRSVITFNKPPEISMSIAASASTVAPGLPVTVSITLTDGSGAPVANQAVHFMAFGAAPTTLSGAQAVTNASGVASVTISSPTAGTTSIVATANYDFAGRSVELTWGP